LFEERVGVAMNRKNDILMASNMSYNHNGKRFYFYDCLESTNKTAKELAALGEKEGTVITSFEQTRGRGRLSREFYSPAKSGVYFSIILRPDMSAENSLIITTAAAVAVARAVEKLSGKKVYIKWVNDIFVNGKKVCGILTESAFLGDGKIDYSVLGIGINLFTPKGGFPEKIKGIAGNIFEGDDPNLTEKTVLEIVDSFFEIYQNIGESNFYEEYKARSLVIGKRISYTREKENIIATVVDIDEKFRLIVEKQDGETDIISTGEVSFGSENFTSAN
jgi:BirA family biotin operon repressor/biotin-[acetyl-CoA-carboxylase] ligase